MIRQAIEKIEELVNAKEENRLEQTDIKGMLYTKFGGRLNRVITPNIESVSTRSLSGLVEIIKSYIDVEAKELNIQLPLIVQAEGNEIKVLSSVDDTYSRQTLIYCKPVVPRLILNEWVLPEEMIINLNTCYVPNVKLTFTPKNDKKEMSVKPVITSKLSPKKSEEIHLFNQVQYDQETGEVTGFRSLLEWFQGSLIYLVKYLSQHNQFALKSKTRKGSFLLFP